MNARPVALADADYDVVIIGGGMAGAGAARDLALRGVSVALLEKGDFASATTSASSKLIHGGLRYLELWDFGLVRESLAERERLRRLAPHLVRPLPFLVPVYRDSSRSLVKVRLGLRLYQWLWVLLCVAGALAAAAPRVLSQPVIYVAEASARFDTGRYGGIYNEVAPGVTGLQIAIGDASEALRQGALARGEVRFGRPDYHVEFAPQAGGVVQLRGVAPTAAETAAPRDPTRPSGLRHHAGRQPAHSGRGGARLRWRDPAGGGPPGAALG